MIDDQLFPIILAFLSVVATGFAAFAAWIGPRKAAEHALALQKTKEERDLKLRVMAVLMAYRKNYHQKEAVQFLNAIDFLWASNRSVKDKWSSFHSSLDARNGYTPAQMDDKYNELLSAISHDLDLGGELGDAEFARVYFPQGLYDRDKLETIQRNQAIAEIERQMNAADAPQNR